MNIKKWIADGNEHFEKQGIANTDELIDAVARLMDQSYTGDIAGEVVFQADNGKYYRGIMEFSFEEMDEDDITELSE